MTCGSQALPFLRSNPSGDLLLRLAPLNSLLPPPFSLSTTSFEKFFVVPVPPVQPFNSVSTTSTNLASPFEMPSPSLKHLAKRFRSSLKRPKRTKRRKSKVVSSIPNTSKRRNRKSIPLLLILHRLNHPPLQLPFLNPRNPSHLSSLDSFMLKNPLSFAVDACS